MSYISKTNDLTILYHKLYKNTYNLINIFKTCKIKKMNFKSKYIVYSMSYIIKREELTTTSFKAPINIKTPQVCNTTMCTRLITKGHIYNISGNDKAIETFFISEKSYF